MDRVAGLEPGQMSKAEFMSRVRAAVYATAEAGLAPAGFSARDCPYIRYWTAFYRYRDAGHVQRAVLRYAPEAAAARSAAEYVPVVADRVRQAVDGWVATRELRGIPEGLPAFRLPGDGPPVGGDGPTRSPTPDATDPVAVRMGLGLGRPLDTGVRGRMESLFHEDFSPVRVHTGSEAAGLARQFRARAFTVGTDIAFAAREYRPGTPVGDAVLAHELAHVVQQRHGSRTTEGSAVEPPGTALEREADRSAAGALMAERTGTGGGTLASRVRPLLRTGLRIQRCRETPSAPAGGSAALAFASSAFNPSVSGALRISDDPSRGAAIVASRRYTASGTVTASGGTDAEAADWEAGFLQTVIGVSRRFDYHDASGHYRYIRTRIPGPTRDGDAGIEPWYGLETVRPFTATSSSVDPEMEDTPTAGRPWTLTDPADATGGSGDLTASDGKDEFCSWLVVRQKSTEVIQYLNWATWEVDWTATYDAAAKTGSGTGTGSRVVGQGTGQGSVTPVLTDPVANEAFMTEIVP